MRINFSVPPVVGKAGRIQIWQAGQTSAPIDVIDLGAANFSDMIAGRRFWKNRPVFVEGNQAIVIPHVGKLAPNATYYVTIESGAFLDAAGATLGELVDPATWQFSTRVPAPSSPTSLVVASDGSGDFCTVQGAVDFVPAANTTPVTITVRAGTYREIVLITAKHNITLHGEDRDKTIIAYANNDVVQQKGGTSFRAMFNAERVNDLVLENMTFHNLTPQDGSQAEAVRIDPGDRAILRNANFLSLQDTFLLTGRVYVTNSYIEGNVDFIWGKGVVYFDSCELKTVGRSGYNVQSRNPMNTYGYVFVDSKLTANPVTLTGNVLGRIDIGVYPYSHVAYINCQMGSHISPVGWNISGGSATTDLTTLRFWEYKSTDLAGAPLDVSMRHAISKQISDSEAAMMRDKAVVLSGWNPTAVTGTSDAGTD